MRHSRLLAYTLSTLFFLVLAGPSSIPAQNQQSVEDQYWEVVKNSTNASDFQSYLNEYPNGKYAAIARQKINAQKPGQNPGTPATPSVQSDLQYLTGWAARVNVDLPETIGDFQLTEAYTACPDGCRVKLDPGSGHELSLIFETSRYTAQSDFLGQVVPALKPLLLPEYCNNTEAPARNMTVVVFVADSNRNQINNFFLFPKDCSQSIPGKPTGARVPVAAELSLQSGIQAGANGRNRIPLNRTDPAYTVQGLDISPAIYLDVTLSDGSKMGPHDYKKNHASNVIFDDTSGDPNDLIEVSYWDIDSNRPELGKYAAQLTSTGKGVGTAYLRVYFRNAPNVSSSVMVEVVSGAGGNSTSGSRTDIQYLNSWAAEVRVGLPEMLGAYKLIDAKSWCPSGCDYSGASGSFNPHLRLIFEASQSQSTVPTDTLERGLKPILLEEYCKTESIPRNLNLNVIFQNRRVTPYNFWVVPGDCAGR